MDFNKALKDKALTYTNRRNKQGNWINTYGRGSHVVTVTEYYNTVNYVTTEGIQGVSSHISGIEIVGKRRTDAGGYKTIHKFNDISQDALDFLAQGQRTEKSLPEPHQFVQIGQGITPQYKKGNGFKGNVYYSQSYIVKEVMGITVVEIKSDLRIEEVDASSKNCWFLLECVNKFGACFDIVTDLEVFYPAHRYKKMISKNMRPKKSADLTELSTVERDFFAWAVAEEFR
jgi:hypothetical protein